MPRNNAFLSDATYATVLQSVPIATVDFVLVRHTASGREFLLGKRTEVPYRGEWFVPGGRIFKGEKMEQAVYRQVHRELGVKDCRAIFIGCLDVMNPPKMGVRWHSIWHFHVVEVSEGVTIAPNKENKRVKWFSHINPHWPVPVKKALAMAGFHS